MRLIGTLENDLETRKFIGFLRTQGVQCSFEPVEDNPIEGPWNLWAHDEQDVAPAREWFSEYRSSPEDAKFDAAPVDPPRLPAFGAGSSGGPFSARREADRYGAASDAVPLGRHLEGDSRQATFPVTIAIILISVAASLVTGFGNPERSGIYNEPTMGEFVYDKMSFVTQAAYLVGSNDSFALVREGEIWRFITPMFLHGDQTHLAFNMLWIFFLGSAIERFNGSLFLGLLTLFTQFGGVLLQVLIPDADWIPETLHGSPFVIGASGAVYGLFGFIWIRSLVDRGYPVYLVPLCVILMIGWLFACMTPLVENVANGAHVGGLLAGMLVGVIRPLGKYR